MTEKMIAPMIVTVDGAAHYPDPMTAADARQTADALAADIERGSCGAIRVRSGVDIALIPVRHVAWVTFPGMSA